MPYKPGCGHRWTQTGTPNRLKCDWCGAIGYTRRSLPGARRTQDRIYVYICGVDGCRSNAVQVDPTRCKKHAS